MRYKLMCEGNLVAEGGNALSLVDRYWQQIKDGWDRGWVLEDTAPAKNQHTCVWTVHWAQAYNGVELSPLRSGTCEPTYKIVRRYANIEGKVDIVATGLTLEEAKGHCRSPETSSATCTIPQNLARTAQFGPWFDGYERE